MVRLLRLALLLVIGLLLASTVVGLLTVAAGILGQAVLGAVGLFLVYEASRVWHADPVRGRPVARRPRHL